MQKKPRPHDTERRRAISEQWGKEPGEHGLTPCRDSVGWRVGTYQLLRSGERPCFAECSVGLRLFCRKLP